MTVTELITATRTPTEYDMSTLHLHPTCTSPLTDQSVPCLGDSGELICFGSIDGMEPARRRLLSAISELSLGRLPYYRLGKQYALCMDAAVFAKHEGRQHDADAGALLADQLLAPLGDVADAELLRDFIAGLAHGLEVACLDASSSRSVRATGR